MLSRIKQNLPAIILFVFFVSLYIYTAAPGVYEGDSGEISADVYTLGLAHPTGFPLYMLTGKIFTLLVPIGDVAYRLNIFSGLLTAFSLVFLYQALVNLKNSQFSSLVASIIFGLGQNTIWSNAGAARVYALSLLLATILIFIFSKWTNEQKIKYLYLYGFLWGLSLGTHAIMIVMGIPFMFMLWQNRSLFRSNIFALLKIIIVTILPGLQYIYLIFAYRKNGIMNWGDMSSFNGFWDYITQKDYSDKIFTRTLSEIWMFLQKALSILSTELGLIFFGVGIIGSIMLYKNRKNIFVPIVVIGITNVVIMFTYGKENADLNILYRYLFIADMGLAIFIAYGLDLLADWTGTLKNVKRVIIFSILILIVILIQLKHSYMHNNRRNDYLVEDTSHNIFNTLESNSIVLAYGDSINGPLLYFQSIGERPDVIVVSTSLLQYDWYISNMTRRYPDIMSLELLNTKDIYARLEIIINKNISQRPVYAIFNDQSGILEKKFDFTPQGLVKRVTIKGSINIKNLLAENDRIWTGYNLRGLKHNIVPGTYKSAMLDALGVIYANALYDLAGAYYKNGFLNETLIYLRKSMEIYPQMSTQKNINLIEKSLKNN